MGTTPGTGTTLTDPGDTMSPVAREDVALVGRTAQVRALADALAAAGDGRPGVWLVAGDAGVGKSRLVRELVELARRRGSLVLTGQCVDLGGSGLPYLPFAEALGQAATDPATAPAVDDLPALQPLLGRGTARPDAGDDDRLPLFDAVHTALGRLGDERGPVLLVVEDLHWADASSRDLLRFVASRLRHERVLVVATYRSDDLHRGHPLRPLLGELPRLPVVERVDLEPFTEDELAGYLGLLTGAPVARGVVSAMHRRSEGNAYFAEELLAAARSNGGRPDGLAELPWTLADVLTSRLDQLSAPTQQLVRVASVAGRRVTDRLLLAASGLPPTEVDAALREAVAHHVLVPDEREGYRFRHALLREAVYNDLLPGERVRTHATYARALAEGTDRGTAAALAHHHLASNDLPGAFAASVQAADDADAVRAPSEALRHLEQALQLWDAVPDAATVAGAELDEVELRASVTAGRAGALQRAVALAESAHAHAAGRDRHRRARIARTLAQHLYLLDRDDEGLRHARWAVDLLADDLTSPDGVWAAATLAKSLINIDQEAEGREVALPALAAARAAGMQSAEADLLATLAVVDWADGDMDLSHEHLVEALEPATSSGDAGTHLRIAYNIAVNRFYAGDLAQALTAADTAAEVARRAGLTWSAFGIESRTVQIIVRYTVGDWDGSLAAAEAAGEQPPDLVANRLATAALYAEVGRGMAGTADKVRALRSAWHEDGQIALVSGGCGVDLLTWQGDHEGALALADEALASLAQQWGDFSLGGIWLGALGIAAAADLADAARLVRDDDAVARALAHGDRLLVRVRDTADKGRPRSGRLGPEGVAWLRRAEAEAARLRRADDEVASWEAAVEAFGYGYPYEQARSRWRLAEALLRADRSADAAAAAASAHGAAVALGAEPLRRAVEASAVRSRLDIGVELVRPADDVLTPREQQVLSLVAEGLTNRQVGARLHISEKTASVHLSNLMGKLGASSRTEAVTLAHRKGLLQ